MNLFDWMLRHVIALSLKKIRPHSVCNFGAIENRHSTLRIQQSDLTSGALPWEDTIQLEYQNILPKFILSMEAL